MLKRMLAIMLSLCMVVMPMQTLAESEVAPAGVEEEKNLTDEEKVPTDEAGEAVPEEGAGDVVPAGEVVEPVRAEVPEQAETEQQEAPVQTITIDVPGEEVAVTDIGAGLPDIDTLFEGYVEKVLYEGLNSGIATIGNYGYSQLSEDEQKIYDVIKGFIESIAGGSQTNSTLKFDLKTYINFSKTVWSVKNGDFGADDYTAATLSGLMQKILGEMPQIDYHRIMDLLMVNCPYELYWYDKTNGYTSPSSGYRYSYSYQGEETDPDDQKKITSVEVKTEVTLRFSVAKDYRDGSAAVQVEGIDRDYYLGLDPAKTSAASGVVSKAQAIVTANQDKSDYEKLNAYREAICGLVEYNRSAADNKDTPYGDPWQLIYVFDGDSDTKVVCEGYSKAFQYLCDLTTFSSDKIRCYTVDGTMEGGTGAGRHMWNIVTMEDGKNYLVDVTNCDTGTVGAPDRLFLVPYTSETASAGYSFTVGSTSITYDYDEDIHSLYGDSILTISKTSYVSLESISDAEVVVKESAFTYNGSEHTPEVTVTLGGKSLTMDTDYRVTYADNKDAGTATVTVTGINNYTGTKTVNFTIEQATPTYTVPSDLKAVYGQALRDVSLSSYPGWSWKDASKSVGDVGTNSFTAVFTPADKKNYKIVEVELSVTVGKIPSSIEFADSYAVTKAYDGETFLQPSEEELVLTGAAYSDVEFSWEKGNESLIGAPKDAGTYRLTASIPETKNTSSASVEKEITISKRQITVTADDVKKVYGEQDPALTYTIENLAAKDTKADAVTGALKREDGNAAGTYQIQVGTLQATANYEMTFAEGTLTISKKPLGADAVKLTAADKVYDGTTKAEISVEISSDALVSGDQITIADVTGVFVDKNVGNSKRVIVNKTQMRIVGGDNYEIAVPDSAVANITAKSLTINSVKAADKSYDGTASAEAVVEFTGLVEGETLVAGTDYTVSAAFDNSTAGDNKAVEVSVALSATDVAKNYSLTDGEKSTQASIRKVPLTITAKDASITYGDAPQGAGATYEGFVAGESEGNLSGSLSYSYNYSQYGNVGSDYKITPEGLTSTNYEITFEPGTLTVQQKELQLTWQNVTDRFAGDGKAVTAEIAADGLVNNDEVTVTVTDGDKTVAGTYTAKAALSGAKAGNYSLKNAEISYVIVKTKSNITVKTDKEAYTYGDSIVVTASLNESGISEASLDAPGDDQMALYYGDTQISQPVRAGADGTYTMTYDTVDKVVPAQSDVVLTVKYTGTGDVTASENQVLVRVNPKDVTVALNGTARKEYDGTTAVEEGDIELVLTGVSESDEVATSQTLVYDNSDVGEDKTITASNVTLTGKDADWYQLNNGQSAFTSDGHSITKKPITLTATSVEKLYGAADPEWDYTVTKGSVVEGETLDVTLERKAGTVVGSYEITFKVGENPNYEIEVLSGTLTIVKLPVELIWDTESGLTYNGKPQSIEAKVKNLVEGDVVGLTYQDNEETDAGTYTAEVTGLSGEDSANYTLENASNVTTKWSIEPKDIAGAEITVSDEVLSYTGKEQTKKVQKVEVDGLDATDSVNVSGDTAVEVGEHILTVTGKGNFTGTASVIWTIEPVAQEPLTITGKPQTVTYGDTFKLAVEGGSGTGAVKWSVTGPAEVDENGNVTIKGVGKITITAVKAADDNHTEAVTTSVTVTAAPKQLTWDASGLTANKYQDGTTDAEIIGTLKLSGLVGEDDPKLTYEKITGSFESAQAGDYEIKALVEGAKLDNSNYVLPESNEITVAAKIVEAQILSDAVVEQPDADEELRLAIDPEMNVVPETLLATEFNTPEKIEDELIQQVLTQNQGYTEVNKETYDVVLQISYDDGKTWTNATKENFPENGLTIVLPYPKNTGMETHDFVVSHMYTSDMGGHEAGYVEFPAVTKTVAGIKVTLSGLSPIGIAWKDVEKESDPEESKPTESTSEESKPTESTPEESKPTESAPEESKPTESAPEESKPTESAPEESKPTESAPEESKPTESAPEESKPTESIPEESKPVESESAETPSEESSEQTEVTEQPESQEAADSAAVAPATGDSQSVLLAMSVMGAAMMAALLVLRMRRRYLK